MPFEYNPEDEVGQNYTPPPIPYIPPPPAITHPVGTIVSPTVPWPSPAPTTEILPENPAVGDDPRKQPPGFPEAPHSIVTPITDPWDSADSNIPGLPRIPIPPRLPDLGDLMPPNGPPALPPGFKPPLMPGPEPGFGERGGPGTKEARGRGGRRNESFKNAGASRHIPFYRAPSRRKKRR